MRSGPSGLLVRVPVSDPVRRVQRAAAPAVTVADRTLEGPLEQPVHREREHQGRPGVALHTAGPRSVAVRTVTTGRLVPVQRLGEPVGIRREPVGQLAVAVTVGADVAVWAPDRPVEVSDIEVSDIEVSDLPWVRRTGGGSRGHKLNITNQRESTLNFEQVITPG